MKEGEELKEGIHPNIIRRL